MYTKKQLKTFEKWLEKTHGYFFEALISEDQISLLTYGMLWPVTELMSFCESLPFANPRVEASQGGLALLFDADHELLAQILTDPNESIKVRVSEVHEAIHRLNTNDYDVRFVPQGPGLRTLKVKIK